MAGQSADIFFLPCEDRCGQSQCEKIGIAVLLEESVGPDRYIVILPFKKQPYKQVLYGDFHI
jgi:hypothetical protein